MRDPEEQDGGLDEGPSKSQVKRELRARQELAERLVQLPLAEVEALSLGDALRAAIDETARIKDLRARRRHFKRIGKLLAGEDLEAVRGLLDHKGRLVREESARHHRVERWRVRLIEEGDVALGELLELCPEADRQRLRQHARAARRDAERRREDASRKLFRLLRETLKDTDLS